MTIYVHTAGVRRVANNQHTIYAAGAQRNCTGVFVHSGGAARIVFERTFSAARFGSTSTPDERSTAGAGGFLSHVHKGEALKEVRYHPSNTFSVHFNNTGLPSDFIRLVQIGQGGVVFQTFSTLQASSFVSGAWFWPVPSGLMPIGDFELTLVG